MDNDKLFNVVLMGVEEGKDTQTVKAAVAEAFKVDVQHVEHLFSGGPKIVKKNQTRSNATRFAEAFRKAGAIVRLESVNPGSQIESSLAARPNTLNNADNKDLQVSKEKRLRRTKAAIGLVGLVIGLILGYAVFNNFRIALYGLTEEEVRLAQQIELDLQNTEQQIAATTVESQKYSRSLVKALVEARLQVHKITADLLKQRLLAIRQGIKPNITINLSQANPDEANLIEKEIEKQRLVIELSKADADRYGGLVGALHSSRLATEQQTLAMLRLRYYSAKYGLPAITAATLSDDSSDTPSGVAIGENSEKPVGSPQEKEKDAKVDAEYIEMCKQVSSYARTVMEKRQDEVPMHKMLEIVRINDSADIVTALEQIVDQAYAQAAMRTSENRLRQQNEFANEVFRSCYSSRR